MADTDLIAGYLTALRGSLRWRPDIDDLVCEVDDHLRCAAGRLEARGLDPSSAQREVLGRFGDVHVVARSFAMTSSGGTAMPTRLTRAAGTFALIAAIGWLVTAPASLIGAGSDDWEVRYTTVALLAFAASACTTVAIFGLLRRAGAGWDGATIAAMLLAILATLLLGVVTWAWLVAVVFLTIAMLLTVLRIRAAGFGTTVGRVLLVAAWPLGVAIALVLEAFKVGPIDSYGDAYIGQLIGFATGCLVFSAALFMSGRWLRSEKGVDMAEPVAAA